MSETKATTETLLWTVEDVCRRLQIGRSRFYSSLKAGLFGPQEINAFGRRKLFKPQEVIDWIDAGAPPRRAWLAMRGGRR